MDVNFWLKRWENNDISGFHGTEAHPELVKHFEKLSLAKGSRVFVPLCGKTLDIAWLLGKGYSVAGAELSTLAIDQLFMGLGVSPKISKFNELAHYSAQNIDIFVGDIFELSGKILGPVDAVYDRAALVALPENMRVRYTKHLMNITGRARQLLLTFEYDQAVMEGPPFSVSNAEVKEHYQGSYGLTLLSSTDMLGGLKGKCSAKENVWLLKS